MPLAGQTAFDGARTSVEATIDAWEARNANLDHEQLLVVGQDGIALGYFDGGKTSVGFELPDGVDPSTLTITHVHPVNNDRNIGGGFSNADVINHINLGLAETRAVAQEGSYSFRTTSESDPKGFKSALANRQSVCLKQQRAAIKALEKQGITLTAQEKMDIYLRASDIWYQNMANRYGYIYRSPYTG